MITMEEIAAKAGLSRYTVSKILNGNTTVRKANRDKVMQLCEQYGFVPNFSAVTLVSGHSNVIAMMVPYITDGFYSELIQLAEQYAASRGYSMTYLSSYNDHETEAKAIRSFIGLKVAALLAVPVVKNPNLQLHRLAASNFPVVYIDRTISDENSSVLNDNLTSGRIMTDHLFEQTDEVAFIDSFYGDDNQTAVDRRQGYLNSVAMHGQKAFFIPNDKSLEKQDNERFGYENFSAYLKSCQRPPKALFCVTDTVALGAMRALRDAGFIPGVDTLVGGHDNLLFTEYTNPPLSSMAQPKKLMAEAAVDIAIKRIKNPKLPSEKSVFNSELIVRASTFAGAEIKRD